ncbi:MAG: type II secretion system protein [Phycisphaerales bacterium]
MSGSGGLSSISIRRGGQRPAARGFSLVDVLFSIGVIAVLIALLMPSMGRVRELARQSVCASNMRQSGIGIHMFADRHDSLLPPSVFIDRDSDQTRNIPEAVAQRYTILIHIRTTPHLGAPSSAGMWDGLGKLYEDSILPAGAVFYCPSYKGENTYSKYAGQINRGVGQIFSNYQYRGKGPRGRKKLYQLDPGVALVADAMADEEYFNHDAGFNVLRVDHSVSWFPDTGGEVAERLAATAFDDNDDALPLVWHMFDRGNAAGD